ncbi:4-aminobutyrate aminotransferase, partial [mine drainage metagenome]
MGSNPTSSATETAGDLVTRGLVVAGEARVQRTTLGTVWRPPASLSKGVTVVSLHSSLGTERKLVTELPGPKSRALHERRRAVVSSGLSTGFPIYITRAEGAILEDVDGNHLLDMGSGIAVISVGHAV